MHYSILLLVVRRRMMIIISKYDAQFDPLIPPEQHPQKRQPGWKLSSLSRRPFKVCSVTLLTNYITNYLQSIINQVLVVYFSAQHSRVINKRRILPNNQSIHVYVGPPTSSATGKSCVSSGSAAGAAGATDTGIGITCTGLLFLPA